MIVKGLPTEESLQNLESAFEDLLKTTEFYDLLVGSLSKDPIYGKTDYFSVLLSKAFNQDIKTVEELNELLIIFNDNRFLEVVFRSCSKEILQNIVYASEGTSLEIELGVNAEWDKGLMELGALEKILKKLFAKVQKRFIELEIGNFVDKVENLVNSEQHGVEEIVSGKKITLYKVIVMGKEEYYLYNKSTKSIIVGINIKRIQTFNLTNGDIGLLVNITDKLFHKKIISLNTGEDLVSDFTEIYNEVLKDGDKTIVFIRYNTMDVVPVCLETGEDLDAEKYPYKRNPVLTDNEVKALLNGVQVD